MKLIKVYDAAKAVALNYNHCAGQHVHVDIPEINALDNALLEVDPPNRTDG